MFPLLLQKPSRSSKSKDHIQHLERRLTTWRAGELDKLVKECCTIQDRLLKTKYNKNHHEKIFAKLMLQGKVSAALRWNGSQKSKLLETTPNVINDLKEKHPKAHPALNSSLYEGPVDDVSSVIFDSNDSNLVEKVAKQINGSGGPSGIDAEIWQHILCSKQFKKKPEVLRESIALLARKLCCNKINPEYLHAYTAGRLIPLDKNPGVRPIGVGEVLRRIIGKTIMVTLKLDIINNTCPIQLCGGLQGGVEAAIHTIRRIFDNADTEAILLVDAENAFNSLNRSVALHNLQITCPELFTYILNTYRKPADLFVANSEDKLISEEGTTQGDTCALGWYALSLMPLVNSCQKKKEDDYPKQAYPKKDYPKQVWYADDTAAGGKISELKQWWDDLNSKGPLYGYFPKASKTWLITKSEFYDEAKAQFSDVNVTKTGHRYLGSFIGDREGTKDFVLEEIESWKADITGLSEIAANEPQLAYAAFVYGTSKRWNFVCRTTPEISEHLQHLEYHIKETFIPAIIGKMFVPDHIRDIISLPAKIGGLGILNCTKIANLEYQNSIDATEQLSEAIYNQNLLFDQDDEKQHTVMKTIKKRKEEFFSELKDNIIGMQGQSAKLKRQLDLLSEKGASSWLTSLPLKECGYLLNKQEFQDAISLRYNLSLSTANRSGYCVCGQPNDINHSLICKIGGYVSLRHNTVRDTVAELLSTVCKDVETEPNLLPVPNSLQLPHGTNRQDGARLDVSARSFWSALDRAFVDVRVLHPQAQSNSSKGIAQMYKSHEISKKREYNQRVLDVEKSCFTPLVFSTTGGMGTEASCFLKRMAEKISIKKDQKYSDVMSFI